MEEFDPHKLVDSGLRDFAAQGGAEEQRSVIIELGERPPSVPLYSTKSPRALPQVGARRVPVDLSNLEGHATLMDDLERRLAALELPTRPVRLNAAQAFVVTVTPPQLRAISRWPLVGPIRPNRVHHVPHRPGAS